MFMKIRDWVDSNKFNWTTLLENEKSILIYRLNKPKIQIKEVIMTVSNKITINECICSIENDSDSITFINKSLIRYLDDYNRLIKNLPIHIEKYAIIPLFEFIRDNIDKVKNPIYLIIIIDYIINLIKNINNYLYYTTKLNNSKYKILLDGININLLLEKLKKYVEYNEPITYSICIETIPIEYRKKDLERKIFIIGKIIDKTKYNEEIIITTIKTNIKKLYDKINYFIAKSELIIT